MGKEGYRERCRPFQSVTRSDEGRNSSLFRIAREELERIFASSGWRGMAAIMRARTRKVVAVAAICATTALLCAWWPAQIDGDWKNERIWGCMCGSGRHFLRFQGGKVIYYAPCEKRAIWIGSYTQIDANAYGISFLGSNEIGRAHV